MVARRFEEKFDERAYSPTCSKDSLRQCLFSLLHQRDGTAKLLTLGLPFCKSLKGVEKCSSGCRKNSIRVGYDV